jgi:WD40 repeat protein
MSAEPNEAELPPTPYKGLVPFDDTDSDARFFFGRERETELIAANLMASRLTVLYGPSGVGKSSLLRAGVIRRLRTLVGAGAPQADGVAVIVDRWRDDPVAAIAAASGARVPDDGEWLADALVERVGELGGELYVVLDQMEEYFLYHGRERGGPLAGELAEVISRPELRVHLLLGIRDDSLSELDAFTARLPGLFGNVVRLEHLDRSSARRAIVGPLEEYARLGGPEVVAQPALVEAVLDQVATGRIEQGLAGRGSVAEETDPSRVEASYLQLVLERLWELERSRDSDVLRAETLGELGGADRIVEEHLERALSPLDADGRELAARLFNHLVTPSGTKIAHSVEDLSRYAEDAEGRLGGVLRDLVGSRIVRPLPARNGAGPRYEIFHDVLANAVLAWRARHETDRALAAERAAARSRHRRLAILAALSLVALAGMALLTVFAFAQRHDARERQRTARAGQLAATALTQLDVDPELSLALAVEAARVERSARVEDVLRTALLESRVRRVARLGRPVTALDVAPHGRLVAATDRALVVLDSRLIRVRDLPLAGRFLGIRAEGAVFLSARGLEIHSLEDGSLLRVIPIRAGALLEVRDSASGLVTGHVRMPERVRFAALGPKGTLLAVSDGTRRTVVVNALTGEARYGLPQPSAVTALTWGPGARLLATGGKDGTARLWSIATGRTRVVLVGHRGRVRDVAFSPRLTLVATASFDDTGRVWRVSDGRPYSVLPGHSNHLEGIAFSPNGSTVVTASDDRTARVWKADTGGQLAALRGHRGAVSSALFVGGNRLVATGSEDGEVRVWNAPAQPQLTLLAELGRPVERIGAVRKGSIVVEAGGLSYVVARGSRVRRIHGSPMPAVRASDGTTARIEGDVVRLRRSDGREQMLEGHTDRVTSVRFSSDGNLAVTASRDRTARIWDVGTGRPIQVLRGHRGIVSDASFSPDGRWVVTAGPGRAGLFRAADGRLLFLLRGHEGILRAAAFDPSGTLIVTGGEDGTVRTYDCDVCRSGEALVDAARRRLLVTGRALTRDERTRLLSP